MRTSLLSSVLRARLPFAVGLAAASVACSAEPTTGISVPTASVSEAPAADIAPRWNAFARSLIVSAKPNQQEALRMLTYLSLAQHEAALDAVQIVQGGGI